MRDVEREVLVPRQRDHGARLRVHHLSRLLPLLGEGRRIELAAQPPQRRSGQRHGRGERGDVHGRLERGTERACDPRCPRGRGRAGPEQVGHQKALRLAEGRADGRVGEAVREALQAPDGAGGAEEERPEAECRQRHPPWCRQLPGSQQREHEHEQSDDDGQRGLLAPDLERRVPEPHAGEKTRRVTRVGQRWTEERRAGDRCPLRGERHHRERRQPGELADHESDDHRGPPPRPFRDETGREERPERIPPKTPPRPSAADHHNTFLGDLDGSSRCGRAHGSRAMAHTTVNWPTARRVRRNGPSAYRAAAPSAVVVTDGSMYRDTRRYMPAAATTIAATIIVLATTSPPIIADDPRDGAPQRDAARQLGAEAPHAARYRYLVDHDEVEVQQRSRAQTGSDHDDRHQQCPEPGPQRNFRYGSTKHGDLAAQRSDGAWYVAIARRSYALPRRLNRLVGEGSWLRLRTLGRRAGHDGVGAPGVVGNSERCGARVRRPR